MTIICDTSGLLGAIDAADPDHAGCAAVLDDDPGPFIVSPFVIAELDYLLRARVGVNAARQLADDLAAGAYTVGRFTARAAETCVAIDRQYDDLGLGLSDAHVVVLASEHGTEQLLSLDERHFRAVRPLHGPAAFQLLPVDGRSG